MKDLFRGKQAYDRAYKPKPPTNPSSIYATSEIHVTQKLRDTRECKLPTWDEMRWMDNPA